MQVTLDFISDLFIDLNIEYEMLQEKETKNWILKTLRGDDDYYSVLIFDKSNEKLIAHKHEKINWHEVEPGDIRKHKRKGR